jgi:hypothetical protein
MKKPIIFLLLSLPFVMVRAQDHPVLLPQPQEIKYGNSQVQIADLTIICRQNQLRKMFSMQMNSQDFLKAAQGYQFL